MKSLLNVEMEERGIKERKWLGHWIPKDCLLKGTFKEERGRGRKL